jgi:5-deoxy-D-glucuronate isomerase
VALEMMWIKSEEEWYLWENMPGVVFSFADREAVFAGEPVVQAMYIDAKTILPPSDVNLFIPCGDGGESRVFTPIPHFVGETEGGFRRMVYSFVGHDSNLPVRAGLTVHETRGTWSSWPPHAFERKSLLSPVATDFSEKFAYLLDPPDGWALQVRFGRWPDGSLVDDVVKVRDRDVVDIPAGSHPVAAGPGCRLAYFWAYTADDLPEKFAEEGRT